jgi:hypothetical protein
LLVTLLWLKCLLLKVFPSVLGTGVTAVIVP